MGSKGISQMDRIKVIKFKESVNKKECSEVFSSAYTLKASESHF